MDWFKQIVIPTPLNVGSVNTYAIFGDEITILDPGPSTDEAYKKLKKELSLSGYSVQDVSRILITHPHIDHYGMASQIQEKSGAQVLAHEHAVHRIANPKSFFQRERAFFQIYLRSMGASEKDIGAICEISKIHQSYQEAVEVDHELHDGSSIDIGYDIETVSTPGHAPGSLCYGVPEKNRIFVGDHVTNEFTPSPILTLVPGSENNRTRGLIAYVSSLKKLRTFDFDRAYSGHRSNIQNLDQRIEEILQDIEEEKEEIAQVLDQNGVISAFELRDKLMGNIPDPVQLPGISKVIGHLDLLVAEGRARTHRQDGQIQYCYSH